MFKFGDKSKEAYCEYKCSKYCEIYDVNGMNRVNGKFVCKACYNCTMEDDNDGHQCKPKPKSKFSIGNMLIPILMYLAIFMLIVSFIVLGQYVSSLF